MLNEDTMRGLDDVLNSGRGCRACCCQWEGLRWWVCLLGFGLDRRSLVVVAAAVLVLAGSAGRVEAFFLRRACRSTQNRKSRAVA